MSSEDTKTWESNQYQKSNQSQFVIYLDLECLIEEKNACKNNTENSFTIKVSKHIPSDFSISKISSLKSIKLGTVIPNLKKIQKIYESCDTPPDFC